MERKIYLERLDEKRNSRRQIDRLNYASHKDQIKRQMAQDLPAVPQAELE